MNYASKCPIWCTPAERISVSGPIHANSIISPRVGGRYIVHYKAEKEISNLSDHDKVKLTAWLVEQRGLVNKTPEITEEVVSKAQQRKQLRVSDRADEILKFLKNKSHILGTAVDIVVYHENTLSNSIADYSEYFDLLIQSECANLIELRYLLDYLEYKKFIKIQDSSTSLTCELTVAGYERLEAIEKLNYDSTRAFIAMWFDEEMNEVWQNGFLPAIRDSGFYPIRIDQKEHVNKIDDEIIAEIRRSRFVVADFTHGKDGARGGVYYETGFAQGLGIPVIFTCRKNMIGEVHFDTRQYNHITWEEPSELKRALENRISAVIGDGPLKSSQQIVDPETPTL